MANVASFSIVFLFENPANSLQVVQSLKEKGVDVHTVSTAPELIQMIAAQKFDLVCLSVNHPSASSLVQVLKIKTQVAVLVFGEDAAGNTSKAVFKTAADYHLAGVISSYNLWMKIGHLVKDKQRHSDAAAKSLSLKVRSEDESAMIIKSSARGKEQQQEAVEKAAVVKSSPKGKAPKSTIISSSDQLATSPHPERKKEKKLLMTGVKKKSLPSLKHAMKTLPKVEQEDIDRSSLGQQLPSEPDEVQNEVSHGEPTERENTTKGKLLKMGKPKIKEAKGKILFTKQATPKQSIAKAPTAPLTEEQILENEILQMENLFSDGASTSFESLESAEDSHQSDEVGEVMVFEQHSHQPATILDGEGDEHMGSTFADLPEVSAGSVVHDNKEDESSYDSEADKIISIEAARLRKKKAKEKRVAEKKIEEEKKSSVHSMHRLKFKKMFKEAVGKAGEKGFLKAENKKAVGRVTKVSLIPVDNPTERGFILMANSQNDFTTIDEVSAFKSTLKAEMSSFGEESFELGDTFNIETFEVNVTEWAERSSQFFYTYESPQSGKQVLICFLKRDSLFPHARKIDEFDMHRIDIYEVPPKTPIQFDAYLFLERNEKMLPYLRRGGSLTAKQIQRLYKRGFKFLYVKDEEVREYYSFYLCLHLNQDFRLERKLA